MIKFHKIKEPHGHMSNFYPSNIHIKGLGICKTSEHLYQSIKYIHNPKRMLEIFNAISPWATAKLGRDPSFPIRSDWETVKDDAMRYTIIMKYQQNQDIAELLLNTGDSILVEHAPHGDRYWGNGGDGTGKNMLGIILQEVRQVLRDQKDFNKWLLTSPSKVFSEEDVPALVYENLAGKTCGMIR
jgi:ribA/ribD-fused uncharacterized protein